MSSQEEPRYVRFGNLPRKSRSTNLLVGERLAGVSVYRGRLDERRGFVIYDSNLNDQGLAALIAMGATDRPAFFVTGEEVGAGPDGEVLLRVENASPVPRSTAITSTSLLAQPSLALWSKGPRDGSGEKLLQWRLTNLEAGYMPPDTPHMTIDSPHARNARRKHKPGKLQQKRKRQKQARKKNRRK